MELAQVPLGEPGVEGLNAGMVLEQMPDHEDPAKLVSKADQFVGLLEFEAEGFFDKDIFAGLESGLGQGIVRYGRGGDGDGSDALAIQGFLEGILDFDAWGKLADGGASRRGRVANQGEGTESVEIADEVFAPIPTPEHGDFWIHIDAATAVADVS
jgi:hypothetical protein